MEKSHVAITVIQRLKQWLRFASHRLSVVAMGSIPHILPREDHSLGDPKLKLPRIEESRDVLCHVGPGKCRILPLVHSPSLRRNRLVVQGIGGQPPKLSAFTGLISGPT